jgi:hypothetical protein
VSCRIARGPIILCGELPGNVGIMEGSLELPPGACTLVCVAICIHKCFETTNRPENGADTCTRAITDKGPLPQGLVLYQGSVTRCD